MNRNLCVAIFAIVFMFVGCHNESGHSATLLTNSDVESVTSLFVDSSDVISAIRTDEFSKNQQTEFSESFQCGFIIKCPYFESSETDYSILNDSIKLNLDERLNVLFKDFGSPLIFDFDYNVTCFDDEYASILYEGIIQNQSAVYPVDMAFSINVDYYGNKITLSDLLNIDEDFLQDFKSAWNEQCITELRDYLKTYDNDELLKLLKNCDGSDSLLCSYVTEKAICIVFPVPNVAGDYMQVKLSRY